MKVAIFNGSPMKDDSTAAVTSSMAKMMADAGADVNEHLLYFMKIKGCLTCGVAGAGKENACKMVGELLSADAAIFASPVYMWNISDSVRSLFEILFAQAKFDEEMIKELEGKKVAVVLATDDGEGVADDASKPVQFVCDTFKMNFMGTLTAPFADKGQVAGKEYQDRIREFTDRIMKG